MTARYESAIPRRDAPEVCMNSSPPELRGRRECRAPDAPAASRGVKNTRVSHHGHTGNTRHSPRNGLRLTSRSPRRPGSFATVIRETAFANLTPASGCQDHTTSPSASARSSAALSASTTSRPASVTTAKRPSVGRDGGGYRTDLGVRKIRIFLQKGLDRGAINCPADLPVGQISSRLLQELRPQHQALDLVGAALDLALIVGEVNALDHGAALEHGGRAFQLQILDQSDAVALGEQRAV